MGGAEDDGVLTPRPSVHFRLNFLRKYTGFAAVRENPVILMGYYACSLPSILV